MKLGLLVPWILFSSLALAGQNINIQGRILNADGTVFKNSSTPFQVSVFNEGYDPLNPNANCLLFRETQTLDLEASEGAFSLVVGNGTRVSSSVDGGYSLEKVFSNSSALASMPATTCPAQSYQPNKSDTRVLVISYYDGSAWDTIPAIPMSWAPQALYAQDAELFSGQPLTEFITKSLVPTCASGNALTWNGTLFSCVSAGTGTVTNVSSANTDISITTATSTPVLTLNTGTGANQIVKLDASSKLPAVDGSALTNITLPVDKITNAAGKYFDYRPNNTACGTGEILKYSAGQGWICSSLASAGSVVSVSAASTANNPLVVSGSSSVTVDLPAATASVNGYLKSTDWTDFNSKQAGSAELSGLSSVALTGILQRTGVGTYTSLGTTAPLTVSGGNLGISQASSTTSGYLTSTDWNSFNGKLATAGGTMTGVLTVTAGTATAPALTFQGDSTTGVYSSSSGNIDFSTLGTQRVRISSEGYLGIGTTSPTATLFVSGPTYLGNVNSTTLTSNFDWNQYVTINVASTTGLPTAGYVMIDNEIIRYVGKTATTLTLSGSGDRGRLNHSTASHNNGAPVYPASLFVQKDSTASGPLAAVFQDGTAVISKRLRSPQLMTSSGSSAYADGLIVGHSSLITGLGAHSSLLGTRNTANAEQGLAVGNNLNLNSFSLSVLGQCNKPVGGETSSSWNTSDPLFVLGNGPTASSVCTSTSNALMIFKDGTSLFNGGTVVTKPTSVAMTVMGSNTSSSMASFNATDSAGSSKFYVRNDGNVGIGTTAPAYRLEVAGHTKIAGHIVSGNSTGTTTVSSCGTSASMSGNDTRGGVTNGSGPVTSCTISFANAYESAPTCIVTWRGSSSPTTGYSVVSTTTDLTVHFSADATGQSFNYICLQ